MALNTLAQGMNTSRFAFSPAASPTQQPNDQKKTKRVSPVVKAAAGAYASNSESGKSSFAGDSYCTLGLRPGSSKQDIKQAYRRLALQYHPDVCKGDHCVPKFKQINAAYEMLQKMVEAAPAYDEDWDDEDEDDVYSSGWEGAWVF